MTGRGRGLSFRREGKSSGDNRSGSFFKDVSSIQTDQSERISSPVPPYTDQSKRISPNAEQSKRISPVPREEQKSPPPGCICLRPKGTVMCKICGWMGKGRVRAVCPVHPRTLYLMDYEVCAVCKSYSEYLLEVLV